MAVSYARLAKQRYDAVTVALTHCTACRAPVGANCRRSGRVCATPCERRMDRRVDLVNLSGRIAYVIAVRSALED